MLSKNEKEYSFSYNEDKKLLHFIWKPVIFSQERFKEIVTLFAEAARQHRVDFIFIDAREHKVSLLPETQTWHDKTIVQKYAMAGVQKIALLVPSNIFSELAHAKVFSQKNATSTLETKFFKSDKDLREWLKPL